MRILLDNTGLVIGLGTDESWRENINAHSAPDFIINSNHMRWQYNGGDINNQANWTELESTFEEIEILVP